VISTELLLHPVRLRIIQALLDGHPLTTSQLKARLPEVSPATTYRQVAILVQAGVLDIVSERRIRGAVERSYQLVQSATEIDPEAIAAMNPDDHRHLFSAFIAGLLADFDRYLDGNPNPDPRADQVTYRQTALWATNEEAKELVAEIQRVVEARQNAEPKKGRTRRLISLISLPAAPRASR
jgi:DNA-binding transcriptional ArsR family regulator